MLYTEIWIANYTNSIFLVTFNPFTGDSMKNRIVFLLTLSSMFVYTNIQSMDKNSGAAVANAIHSGPCIPAGITVTPLPPTPAQAPAPFVVKPNQMFSDSDHYDQKEIKEVADGTLTNVSQADLPINFSPYTTAHARASRLISSFHAETDQLQVKNSYNSRAEFEEDISKIPGARSSEIDAALAEEVLKSCPQKIADIIARIEHDVYRPGEKDIVLFGLPGMGKSTIAQAIAKKCNIPCIFFDAGKISTFYQNEGLMNLQKIFASASRYGKPCIIALDEIGLLIDKYMHKENNESGILTGLWQEMDKVSNSKIIIISSTNSMKNTPEMLTSRATAIEIPLPTQEQREKALKFHLDEQQKKLKIKYAHEVTAKNLAPKTNQFSYRDIRNLITKATAEVAIGKNNKIVTMQDCLKAISSIVNDPQRKIERAKGTWLYETTQYLKKNALPIAGIVTATACGIYYHLDAKATQKRVHLEEVARQEKYRLEDIARQERYRLEDIARQEALQAENTKHIENSNKNAAESLANQKLSTAIAGVSTGWTIGGATGGFIGGAIGRYYGGAKGAKQGAEVGAFAGSTAGSIIGAAPKKIWDGTKWIAQTAYQKTSENCSIQ